MPPVTEQMKRDVTQMWLPIGAVMLVLGVVGGAAITWATDRAELRMTTVIATTNQRELTGLKEERAARVERDRAITDTLARMQAQLDKISTRLGVQP